MAISGFLFAFLASSSISAQAAVNTSLMQATMNKSLMLAAVNKSFIQAFTPVPCTKFSQLELALCSADESFLNPSSRTRRGNIVC
jgi:hypothetical protein